MSSNIVNQIDQLFYILPRNWTNKILNFNVNIEIFYRTKRFFFFFALCMDCFDWDYFDWDYLFFPRVFTIIIFIFLQIHIIVFDIQVETEPQDPKTSLEFLGY